MAVRSIRRVKYKFKWTKELTFLLLGLAVIIVVTIILALPNKVERLINKWPDASLGTETVYQEVSESQLVNLVDSGEYIFVFYGSPSDTNATTNLTLVETYASNFNVDRVYWLDSTEIYNASDETKNTRDFKDDIAQRETSLKGVDLLETLSFWAFNDGNLLVDYAKYSDSSDTNSFEQVVSKAFGAYVESLN